MEVASAIKKWNFPAPRLKHFSYFQAQPSNFFPKKISYIFFQKKPTLKLFLIFPQKKLLLYFGKWLFSPKKNNVKRERFSLNLKKLCYISGGNLQSQKMKNLLYFFHILRENFPDISAKEKHFLYFPYREVEFSKLKYFMKFIVKRFFSI